MASVYPNLNCGILIDEFIKMATEHMLTVKGTIITQATAAPTGTPVPSQVSWKGYKLPPTQREIEFGGAGDEQPNVNTTYEAGRAKKTVSLFAEEEEDIQNSQNVVYPNLNKADGTKVTNYGNTPQTNYVASVTDARAVAEAYLGSAFTTDQEYSNFISLIAAESSLNQTEQAYVAAVILNRTRLGVRGAKTVSQTINSPGQFEPVTGPASSRIWYLKGPTPTREKSIFGSIKEILPNVDKGYVNFTSNDDCLYIKCTNGIPIQDANGNYQKIKGRNYQYLLDLRSDPSAIVIGGTIFSKGIK